MSPIWRRGPQPQDGGRALLADLVALHAAGDELLLAARCRRDADRVAKAFDGWLVAAAADPATRARQLGALLHVARCFDQALGRPELLARAAELGPGGGDGRGAQAPWVRLQRSERSERAAALGLRHRYRGALTMLTTAGPRVVMTQALEPGDGEPVYGCVVPAGARFSQPHPGPEPPEYVLARAGGALEPRHKYRESQLVPPDEAALQAAIRDALAAGPGAGSIAGLQAALLDGYVWVAVPDPGPDGQQADLALFDILAAPGPAEQAALPDPADSRPLNVFTDLGRAERAHAAVRQRVVAARVPFVAACVLADRLGRSEAIVVDPGSEGQLALPRAWYLRFPGAVVGYDLAVRSLPSGGIDPAWLAPLRSAVLAEPGVLAACAWVAAHPDRPEGPGTVEVLGLVAEGGADGFDRVRLAVRERAIASGLDAGREYGVASLEPGAPHLTDVEHAVALEVRGAGGRTPEAGVAAAGGAATRPRGQWWPIFDTAAPLISAGSYHEAERLLQDALGLIDSAAAQPHLADARAVALIGLGRIALESGQPEEARRRLETAVAHCEATGLQVNLLAALRLCFDADRYLGLAEEAARDALRIASWIEGPGGRFMERQADIVRAGEPLLRVIASVAGEDYELDDVTETVIASGGGHVRFDFRRNRPAIASASRAARAAAAAASAGRFDEARRALEAARALDPYDPDPVYQEGVLLLDTGRFAEAAAAFREAERLAPGWFLCRRYGWLAERVAAGLVPPEAAAVAIRVDDDGVDPASRLRLLDSAPTLDVAMLHLYRGHALSRLGRRAEAEGAMRRGLAAEGDDDTRSELLVALATLLGPTPEARTCLADALPLRGHLVSQASARVSLRMMRRIS